jgi:hypothetical protein
MDERRRLHSAWTHISMQALFGLWAASCVAAGAFFIWKGRLHPPVIVFGILFVLFGLLVGRTFAWRARPVWVEGDFLVVGRGRRARRVHCLDVVTIQLPWWASGASKWWGYGLSVVTPPTEITVRGGHSIFFYPDYGAEHLIFGARRHARALADGGQSLE